jgi:tetratricopeptide (TPR) repeat protein
LNAAKSYPDSAVPQYFLGVTYLDLGESAKALTAFEAAARIEPQTARIYVGMGFACFKLKRYDEALKHFEHARKLNVNVPYALSGLGATYAQLKDYGNAEKALKQAVSFDPDNATARFNLGLVCLARRKRDCALTQYNYLKIKGHTLAGSLFTSIFRGRVIDASKYKNP